MPLFRPFRFVEFFTVTMKQPRIDFNKLSLEVCFYTVSFNAVQQCYKGIGSCF